MFVDNIRLMDDPAQKRMVTPSQGIHLVVEKKFMTSNCAMMIPRTADGRVLFALPWKQHVLIGTTDTAVEQTSIEPRALHNEISFILTTIRQYLKIAPEEKDVLSIFAGLRPLAAPKNISGRTKEISRDHKLVASESGLITITGGKWTTYRKMAEDTVRLAIKIHKFNRVECKTINIKVHGYTETFSSSHLSVYGSDEPGIIQLIRDDDFLAKKLCAHLPHTYAEVVWAVRHEMACTVEDVLARRTRILFFDAAAAINASPIVAELIASELNYDENWKRSQLLEFSKLAHDYLIPAI